MEIINLIRSAIDSDFLDRDFIIDLAAEYDERCAALNARLGEISRLLRAGNRSEAITLAEKMPNALQTYGELDFPELPDWNMLLAEEELGPAVRLLEDYAAELDEALNEGDELGPLLKKHRVLALRRGPLKQRISVLRSLLKVSSDNPLWQQDLQDYEAPRLKEITQEANAALRQNDSRTLAELLAELNSEWTIAVDPKQIQSVQKAFLGLQGKSNREKIKSLNSQLNQSLTELDVEKARSLKGQWDNFYPNAQMSESHPLYQEVSEVFDWLDEEADIENEDKLYADAVGRLEALMDQRGEFAAIERQYYRVERFNREIAEVTNHRFRDFKSAHEAGRKRKFITVVSVSCLAILLLAAGVYFFIDSINFATRKNQAMTELTIANEEKKWSVSMDILNNMEPRLQAEPEIQKLAATAETGFQAETARVENLASIMKQLREAPRDPPPAALVEQAAELAMTPTEKQTLTVIEKEISTHQQGLLSQRNSVVQTMMQKKLAELTELEADEASRTKLVALDQLASDLQKAYQDSNQKRYQLPTISDPILQQLAALQKRVLSSFTATENRLDFLKALGRVRASAKTDTMGVYSDSIKQFTTTHPLSAETRQLRNSEQEIGLFQQWNQWRIFLSRREWAGIVRIEKDAAQVLLDRYDLLLKDSPKGRPASGLQPSLDFLNKIAGSLFPEKTDLISLQQFFEAYPISKLWVLERKVSGSKLQKFYVPPNPVVNDGEANSQVYYTGVPLGSSDTSVQKSTDIRNVIAQYPAPHNKLAQRLRELIKNREGTETPEKTIFKLVDACLAPDGGDKPVDVILRSMMLEEIIAAAMNLNSEIKRHLQPPSDSLKTLRLSTLNWVRETTKDNLDQKRIAATEILKEIDASWDPEKIEAAIEQKNSDLAPPKRLPLVWVGALFKDESGQWKLDTRASLTTNTDLFFLTELNGEVIPQSLGTWKTREDQSGLIASKMQIGRLVYQVKTEK